MSAAVEEFQPIYEGRDFYVPAFDIKIEGVEIDKYTAKDVMEVKYTDALDKIGTMELTVNNWDADLLDFKYTGPKSGTLDERSTLFDPGQVVHLFMGYHKPIEGKHDSKKADPLRLMLAGKIHKLAPSFPAAGNPVLKVSAQSVLAQLSAKQETKNYAPKMTATKIAHEVAARGKLKLRDKVLKLEPQTALKNEPELEFVMQNNQYDIVFLIQLAHRQGYDVVLKYRDEEKREDPYLFFGPTSDEPRISYLLEWGRSLVSFMPTLNTAQQVKEVTVCGWNMKTKQPIKVTVDRTKVPNSPLKDKKQLERLEEGFKEKAEIIVDRPFNNETEAREYALAQMSSITAGMVTARGSTVGAPDLRAGSRVEIKGLGGTFSGRYTVTSSTHTIGAGGYVTEFEARRQERK